MNHDRCAHQSHMRRSSNQRCILRTRCFICRNDDHICDTTPHTYIQEDPFLHGTINQLRLAQTLREKIACGRNTEPRAAGKLIVSFSPLLSLPNLPCAPSYMNFTSVQRQRWQQGHFNIRPSPKRHVFRVLGNVLHHSESPTPYAVAISAFTTYQE